MRVRRRLTRSVSRCAVLSALVLSPVLAQTEQPLAVTAVRFWSFDGVTRIAIESTGDFEYRSDRLTNPDRVYFDIAGAMNRVGPRRRIQHSVPVGDGVLKQIRIAETKNDTRVVFDLEPQVEVTASQLANPPRLMVEIRSAPTGSAPLSPDPIGLAAKPEPSVLPQLQPRPELPARTEPVPVGLPAKRDSSGNRSLVRALGLKIGRVIIDPGHGGHDMGTVGPSGVMEKDVVLDISKRLAALMQQRLGSEVILTRTDDSFIPLEHRTALANEKGADLFVSIHVNSSPVPSNGGVETYYLNFTTSRADLEVAARENAGSQRTVHELTELIQKIALKEKIEESRELAAHVQSALFAAAANANSRARNRGVKKAPFVVLIGATMPSILTEIGFVTNPREESLLRKPAHRQKIAEALYKGLAKYADSLSRFEVAKREK